MGVNKVEYGDEVLMDLSKDTVTPETLAEGVTAHDASGEPIIGTMSIQGVTVKVTNLKGTTWTLNNTIDLSAAFTYNVNFTDANGINYTAILVVRSWQEDDFVEILRYGNEGGGNRLICDRWNGGDIRWLNENAKTITFTGGADVNNLDLANYLRANGELIALDLSQLQPKETVDKISSIDCGTSASTSFNQYGISANHDATIYGALNEAVADIVFKTTLPIVAGENVTFERDADKEVIKINATGGKAIIDVAELPTENINEEAFYRVPVGTFFYEDEKNNWTCIVVDTLPEDALPVTTDMVNITMYYDISSGNVSGYADEMISGVFGIPAGWYPVEVGCQLTGNTWNGIVFDESELPQEYDGQNRITLLIKTDVYQYKNSWVKVNSSVGFVGTGYGAEVFNSKRNIASGDYSHAEGYRSYALGNASHAEGNDTSARGVGSHSEGNMTGAYGNYSHAEGEETLAHGYCQHVQGKRNIEDTENKYAHIVGNGENLQNRSNAHTIDWQGNGWFAGTIKVGGTGQDDENAKELATKEYSALSVTVSTDYPTSMSAIITAIQEAGGDISKLTFVTLTGYLTRNLAMSFAWRGGNYYRVECIDLDNLVKIYYAPTDNSVYDATTMRIAEFLDAGMPKEEMPQIRFISAHSDYLIDNGGHFDACTHLCDEDNPLKFTVEIVGGGALQEGDTLQLCVRRNSMGSEANGYRAKYKLRKFAEYEITYEDLNKRYLTVATHEIGENLPRVLYHDGRTGSGTTLSPIYIRIRRPKGDMQNNDSGKTVDATFSNIVTVWKMYYREARQIKIL